MWDELIDDNGEPTGVEGNGTTETGSYTLNGAITGSALAAAKCCKRSECASST